jgi:hypothetical protein
MPTVWQSRGPVRREAHDDKERQPTRDSHRQAERADP